MLFLVDCISILTVLLQFILFLILEHISLPSHFVGLYVFVVSIPHATELSFFLVLESALLWVNLVQGLVRASWWEGLVPVHWWVELGLNPLWTGLCQGVCLEVPLG